MRSKKGIDKNKNIFGQKFQKLFSTKARNIVLSVIALLIIVSIAQYIIPSLPGSFAYTPNPQPINGIPIQPNPSLGRKITITSTEAVLHDIYGDNLVYSDVDDNGSPFGDRHNLVLYNIKSGQKEVMLSVAEADRINDAGIYGTKVVWSQFDSGNFRSDIYVYDFVQGGEATKISPNKWRSNEQPSIYGDRIVWLATTGFFGSQIVVGYGPETGFTPQVINNDDNQKTRVDIHKNIIVWGNTYPSRGIHMYNITTGVESTVVDSPWGGEILDDYPTVYDDNIVWTNIDLRQGINSLKLYQIQSQRTSTIATVSREDDVSGIGCSLDVYENKIVWGEKNCDGYCNSTIKIFDLKDPPSDSNPLVLPSLNKTYVKQLKFFNKNIVWEGGIGRVDPIHFPKMNISAFVLN